jgi:hypothetical protein
VAHRKLNGPLTRARAVASRPAERRVVAAEGLRWGHGPIGSAGLRCRFGGNGPDGQWEGKEKKN